MIISFKCELTEELWRTGKSKKLPPEILKVILRKLLMLDNAAELKDLLVPPSNRLESLYGDRSEQYSIRINIRWRICFVWKNNDVYDVEIIDYH